MTNTIYSITLEIPQKRIYITKTQLLLLILHICKQKDFDIEFFYIILQYIHYEFMLLLFETENFGPFETFQLFTNYS